jgi:hypothetical protein
VWWQEKTIADTLEHDLTVAEQQLTIPSNMVIQLDVDDKYTTSVITNLHVQAAGV